MVMSIFKKNEFLFIGHKKHVLKTLSLIKEKEKIKLILDESKKSRECFLFTLKKWFFIKNSYKIYLTYPFPYAWLFFLFFLFKIDIIFMHSYWRRWPQDKKKLFYYITLKIICAVQKKIKIIVLGEWIYKNIQKDILLNKKERKQFNWINHPCVEAKNIEYKIILNRSILASYETKSSHTNLLIQKI